MILITLVIISSIVFFVVAPVLSLLRYYAPVKYTWWHNVLWTVITLLTWPVAPIMVAWHRRDKTLLSLYWVSFLGLGVFGSYWLATNMHRFIFIQRLLNE